MSAYPETLLPNARSLLADAADYAVVDLGLAIDDFFTFFSASAYARRIERGDRSTILGISGIELARNVLSDKAGQQDFKPARESLRRTKAYWTGWILAFYQWTSNRSFRDILQALPASTIEQMYGVYHEAPEERFAATADEIIRETGRKICRDRRRDRSREVSGDTPQASPLRLRMFAISPCGDVRRGHQIHTVVRAA